MALTILASYKFSPEDWVWIKIRIFATESNKVRAV